YPRRRRRGSRAHAAARHSHREQREFGPAPAGATESPRRRWHSRPSTDSAATAGERHGRRRRGPTRRPPPPPTPPRPPRPHRGTLWPQSQTPGAYEEDVRVVSTAARQTQVPLDHLFAELLAYPLAAESAFADSNTPPHPGKAGRWPVFDLDPANERLWWGFE